MAIEAYGTHATSPYLLVLQAPIGARDNALSASLYCLLQAKSAKSSHNAISENIKLCIKSRVTGARNHINLFSMHIRATHIATFPTVCRSMGCCSLLCGALNGIVIEWLFFVMALCHNREIRRINGDPINTP